MELHRKWHNRRSALRSLCMRRQEALMEVRNWHHDPSSRHGSCRKTRSQLPHCRNTKFDAAQTTSGSCAHWEVEVAVAGVTTVAGHSCVHGMLVKLSRCGDCCNQQRDQQADATSPAQAPSPPATFLDDIVVTSALTHELHIVHLRKGPSSVAYIFQSSRRSVPAQKVVL
eukprot:CAMPEP_0181497280 /NCGR_PEP_ID=MMETSP1110-20121109/53451_1 /TAXON_ID=174948 /ORGANISM="Symbiodinium sp., Strain CCMP421" /LENGTH=169 /DNA_ID=CAMNT_0023625209 /DNA_START=575 /DNA_END=1085 /DNA_ORIENTATION=+